ncbi:flagellar biosynthesis protein FliQ [Aquabacterium sp. OR-4]|uniref:flagellar biosynthesis protein FliQ n=1 Tax=Aquabacterium sp. OR-4 TaxID=2978127 RepID=UPI0021B27816|nr:flagellar biosynthesis protein FliQ [Aquabacterium sp. OR-4]MDT7836587.1 flagellar biosynthesis protein FliQ [Aquabacterium sp. OR-4]
MDSQQAFHLGQQGLYMLLLVSAPLLITVLLVGLVISVFQAATQINEATLSFVPKVVAAVVVLAVAGPWMLTMLTEYIQQTLLAIPSAVG